MNQNQNQNKYQNQYRPSQQGNNYNNNFNKNHNFTKNYDFNNNQTNNQNQSEEDKIKSYLLDYLYNKIEVSEHKYTLIKNISDIYDIKTKKYYCSGNSCGINSLIIFLKKDNEYYSYWIDRRSISYNKQTLKKSMVRISKINLTVDLKFYDGTILDGILIDNENNIVSSKTSINSQKMNFMVNDVFTFCGKSMITIDYKIKMNIINFMFEKMIEPDNSNNVKLFINRPFEINQLNNLFKNYIEPNIKILNIKGLTFYPFLSGNKLIYIYDKQDEQFKNNLFTGNAVLENNNKIDNEKFEYSDKKRIFKFELTNPECIDDIVLNLEMKKTNTPDVYKLFGIFRSENNNKIQFIKKRIGCAYIPTYISSLKCSTCFINKESIIMSCLFNTNKNKWVPIDEAEIQKIDIINDEKRLKVKIIEQEVINDNELNNNDND